MKKITSLVFIIALSSFVIYAKTGKDWLIQIVFHQDKYLPGDTAFFKVWLLDENLKPVEGTQILRIDLVDNLGHVAFTQNFRIRNGAGKNQIKLPDEIKPGAYISNLSVYGSPHYSSCGQLIVAGEKTFNYLTYPNSFKDSVKSSSIELLNVKRIYKTREKVEVALRVDQRRVRVNPITARVFSTKALESFPKIPLSQKSLAQLGKPVTKIVLRGRVLLKNSNEPVPDSTHVAIFLTRAEEGYDFYTRKNGQFEVSIIQDFYEDDKAFVIAQSGGKELAVNMQLEAAPENPIQTKVPLLTTSSQTDSYTDFVLNKRAVDKSFHFFSSSDSMESKNSFSDQLERKFHGADIAIKIEDYLIFPTMEDIVREIIPALFISKTKSEIKIGMNLLTAPEKVAASKNNPLIVIDGVMTKDANYFLNLKPNDIISVKLVRKLYKLIPFGLLGENGIILVSTKNTKIANELVQNMTDVKGLTKPIPYFSKMVSQNENSRLPDLRLSLCWDSEVLIGPDGNASFSFSTSDALGEFVIQVFGINDEGEMVRASELFQVTR